MKTITCFPVTIGKVIDDVRLLVDSFTPERVDDNGAVVTKSMVRDEKTDRRMAGK